MTNPGMSRFARMDEYRALLESVASVSTRRQSTHNLFVGLNVVFLSAIGFLLASSHFCTWWLVAAVGAIAATVLPVNIIWRLSLSRYRDQLNLQFEYLREIELEFRDTRGIPPDATNGIGLYIRIHQNHRANSGNTRLEMRLASYCILLFPLITVIAAVLTYLITNNYLPTPSPL